MAETAQDSTVPLRGGDGKLKDEDAEDGARPLTELGALRTCETATVTPNFSSSAATMKTSLYGVQWSTRHSMALRRAQCCKRPAFSTSPIWTRENASRCEAPRLPACSHCGWLLTS